MRGFPDADAHSGFFGMTLRLSSFDGCYTPAAVVHGRPSWKNGEGRVLFWSVAGHWVFSDAIRDGSAHWAVLVGAAEVLTGATVGGQVFDGKGLVDLTIEVVEEV